MSKKLNNLVERKQFAAQLYSLGRPDEAMRVCEEIYKTGDRDPGILCLLGVLCRQSNQYSQAVKYCEQAIVISPQYVEAHYHLGCALLQQGYARKALKPFEYVLSKAPANADVQFKIGSAREWLGDYDEAVDAYRNAQELQCDFFAAILGEVSVYEKQGELSKAYQVIKPYLNNDAPLNEWIALAYGRIAPDIEGYKVVVGRLSQALSMKSVSLEGRLQLHFMLGKIHDKAEEFEEAFQHFQEGNRLKDVEFDVPAFRNLIDVLVNRFQKKSLLIASRSECKSHRPIFIVGMMRSGTSLVEQILSGHNKVFAAGELPYLDRLVRALAEDEPDITRLTTQQLNRYAEDYLNQIHQLNDDAIYVVDKMPQNFMHLGYISLLFPGARIIHCKRSSIDTCLSCYFQNFSAAHAYTFDLVAMGHCYLGYQKLMNYWKRVLDISIYDVSYEQLVDNPDEEIARLLDFCGLYAAPGCFRFYESKRTISTASYDQVRKPIYKNSAGRWKNYAKKIEVLIKLLE
ncbi:MAG: sulfotransferase [Gammaproteobacteria bacterium]